MAKLQSDLSEFVGLLNSNRVEFLVVGGHAVAFHGHPRFTGDIDFLIAATPDNAERVLQVLTAFGFAALNITVADLLTPATVVQLGYPPNRIDILTSISGVEFADAWPARVASQLGGEPVNFIGFDDLLRNKRASGRTKDLADVEQLLAVAKRR